MDAVFRTFPVLVFTIGATLDGLGIAYQHLVSSTTVGLVSIVSMAILMLTFSYFNSK